MSDADVPALLERLRAAGLTLAVAESLTGGQLADALISVPGASDVVRGGVVAYATDLKAALLGVDQEQLDRHGPVHPGTAEQMAAGVRARLGADIGLSTTGVAGPGPSEGHPAGTVHVGLAAAGGTQTRSLCLDGDRADVRAGAVQAVLELLGTWARKNDGGGGVGVS